MLTETLLRIPFSVIGRTFSSAELSLAAGKMRKSELVTGCRYDRRRLSVSIFRAKMAALRFLKRVKGY